ncbi:glycogen-binding domain-containing protein [Desulfovibrio aminophilus]|uniref:glycogen-binding domain-containing protein n=1 Tax=Desulfovibrio aminophilus TaxID=81425 RepID=UPI003390B38B
MSDAELKTPASSEIVDAALTRALRALPLKEPPAGFAAGVLRGLAPKRPSFWRRAWIWARTPRPLTVTPLRLAAAACLLLLLVLPALRGGLRPDATTETASGLLPVTFLLPDPDGRAHTVAVIGSFNRWNPAGFEMRYSERERAWVLKTQLPPGSHEYVFLADGRQAVPDPASSLTTDDGFGNRNSILFLANGHERKI